MGNNDDDNEHNDHNNNAEEEADAADDAARKRRDGHSDPNDDQNDEHNDNHDDQNDDHEDDKANDWHVKWFDSNNYNSEHHFNSEMQFSNWFPSEPNGSGNQVFMHVDNGKWFDMDGEKWTSSYVCVKDTEMVEVVHMEEHHSGVAQIAMS